MPDDHSPEPETIEVGDRYLAETDPAVEIEVVEIVEQGSTTYCRLQSTRLGEATVYRRPRSQVRDRLRDGDYARLR